MTAPVPPDANGLREFWDRVAVGSAVECWEWLGTRNPAGYGRVWLPGGASTGAHRRAYELAVGPIADGLVIDHLCRNTSCVNPSHLEPVTVQVNTLRGIGLTALNARKTRCVNGHEYTPENTRITPCRKGRDCRTCHRERMAELIDCPVCSMPVQRGNKSRHIRRHHSSRKAAA